MQLKLSERTMLNFLSQYPLRSQKQFQTISASINHLLEITPYQMSLMKSMPNPIYTPKINIEKKKRTNWKKELNECRLKTLQEVRDALIAHKIDIPKDWHIGYMSAVSVVEIMKNKW